MEKKQITKYITIFSILCLGSPVSSWAVDTTTNRTDGKTIESSKNLETLTSTPLKEQNTIDSTTSSILEEKSEPIINSEETTTDSSVENKNQNKTEKITDSDLKNSTDKISQSTTSTQNKRTENDNSNAKQIYNNSWEYTTKDGYQVLDKYIGQDTNVIVPNNIDGIPTKIESLSSQLFSDPNAITSFKIESSGSKVPVTAIGQGFSNLNNLQSVDFSNAVFVDLSMSNNSFASFFMGSSKLEKVNMSGLDFSTLNSNYVSNMFKDCTSLQSVNFSSSNFSDKSGGGLYAVSFFENCTSLTNIDFSNAKGKISNLAWAFKGCTSLVNMDFSMFQFDSIANLNMLFNDTPNLRFVNLTTLPNNVDRFMDAFKSNSTQPLMILTNNPTLLKYNYSNDHRIPTGPVFEANGGQFENQQTTKTYFDSCAISPQDPKLQLATFQQFKQDLKPTRDTYLFESWKLTEGSEPVKDADLFNTSTYTAQWTPSLENGNIPSQNVDNVKPDTTSIYGIAYMPKAFSIPSTQLTDEAIQNIPISSTSDYHVAVRDQRMTQGGWTLQAQLVWNGNVLQGSYIQTGNGNGEVKKNTNNGQTNYQSSDLVANDGTVIGESNVKITNTPTIIMTGQNVSRNGVYDYDLGNVSLILENANTIQAGKYTGNINWNLTNTP